MASGVLTCAGADLEAGQSTTVTVSGTSAAGATGCLTNTVTVTGNDPDRDDTNNTATGVSCPGTLTKSFTVEKEARPSVAHPGDTVTYAVRVANTGNVAYSAPDLAGFRDDLTGVLSNAVYNADATGGATFDGTALNWSGELPVGGSAIVTWTVTVNSTVSGTKSLINALTPSGGGGSCATATNCTTVTPVKAFTVAKSASPGPAIPGQTVTYTVTVTNTGAVDYTGTDPAGFDDTLTGVLDDGAVTAVTGGATIEGALLHWSGPLAAGASTTVTYTVTVHDPDTGDHVLTNFAAPISDGGRCATVTGCVTTTPVESYTVVKRASLSFTRPAQVVVYTVTVTNTGAVDYTDAHPASFADDLTDVLDDATYNGDATGGAVYTAPVLSWSGPLATGATTTVTYSVTPLENPSGAHRLTNTVVTPADRPANCPAGSTDPDCTVTVPVASYVVSKAANPKSAAPGGTVVYTLAIRNTGAVPFIADHPATLADDLDGVLDDASYTGSPTPGVTMSGSILRWSGPLDVGATQTVVYTVRVDDPDQGDGHLRNVLLVARDRSGGCPSGIVCATDTPVRSFHLTKAASVPAADPGQKVAYTVTVTNTGTADYTDADPASFTDDLHAVLASATYDGDATGGATYAGGVLRWSGPLAVGATATITYHVTIRANAGEARLPNTVVSPAGSGGDCPAGTTAAHCRADVLTPIVVVVPTSIVAPTTTGPSTTTTTAVVPTEAVAAAEITGGTGLPVTGTDLGPLVAGAVLGIGTGGLLLVVRRRRRT